MIETTTDDENNIINHAAVHRIIKRLVEANPKVDDKTDFASFLLNVIKPNAEKWANARNASFIIVSLLENKSTQNELKKLLQPKLKQLKASDQSGTKIVVQHLEGKATKKPTNKK